MKNLLKILVVLIFAFVGTIETKAASTEYTCPHDSTHKCVDLAGYAWGADSSPFGGVGWINFNNTASTGSNTSSGVDYKVYFDRGAFNSGTSTYSGGGNLYGYAWSERYGYIKFGGFTEGAGKYPNSNACVDSTNNDTNCNVQLKMGSNGYELVGYARFCFVYKTGCSGDLRPNSELGGYDGWVAFKGTNVSVKYSTSDNDFIGYAWGGGSGNISNADYGEGSGWIKLNPTNGGVSCVVNTNADCLDDQDKPILTLTANPKSAKYSEDVTLSWTATNIPNGCTASTSSSPTNSTWNGYTPPGTTGTRSASAVVDDSINIGQITESTTFTIKCVVNNKIATASVIVDILSFTPKVTLSAPATVVYGQNATLNYTVTNIPYDCTGALYRNGTVVSGYDNIDVTSDGTKEDVYEDSITVNNITANTNWEFRCTDSTAPSPARVGIATAKTDLDKTPPTLIMTVKDIDTNSTTTIPCTNSGVSIEYSSKDVLSGSCKAYTQLNGSLYDGNPDWGSATTIVENDHPNKTTETTSAVTQTGDNWYYLQCKRLNGNLVTASKRLNRSCTAGTLTVTAAEACIEPTGYVDINYVGTDLVSGSCTKSWGGTVNQSNFNLHYTRAGSTLTVGQTYTYTVSDCKQASDPNGTSLSQSVDVEVQNSCTGDPVNPRRGPKFKEF